MCSFQVQWIHLTNALGWQLWYKHIFTLFRRLSSFIGLTRNWERKIIHWGGTLSQRQNCCFGLRIGICSTAHLISQSFKEGVFVQPASSAGRAGPAGSALQHVHSPLLDALQRRSRKTLGSNVNKKYFFPIFPIFCWWKWIQSFESPAVVKLPERTWQVSCKNWSLIITRWDERSCRGSAWSSWSRFLSPCRGWTQRGATLRLRWAPCSGNAPCRRGNVLDFSSCPL